MFCKCIRVHLTPIQEIKDVTTEENLFVCYVMQWCSRIRIRLSSFRLRQCWLNPESPISCRVAGFTMFVFAFSRATIFDHTELAEYLISLVNMVQVQTHTFSKYNSYKRHLYEWNGWKGSRGLIWNKQNGLNVFSPHQQDSRSVVTASSFHSQDSGFPVDPLTL